jgi:hypothetical protein
MSMGWNMILNIYLYDDLGQPLRGWSFWGSWYIPATGGTVAKLGEVLRTSSHLKSR